MEEQFNIKKQWRENWKRYNIALIVAGFFGFMSYCIVGVILVPRFEATIFTTFFQGIAYLIIMGIANMLYFILMNIDYSLNKPDKNSLTHKILYYGYFGISCLLPFSVSIMLFIIY